MQNEENCPIEGRPLLFGEVLFDRFPDGSAVLGGAPFNVAWHLHGFGVRPLFVSRIGDDALGQQVLAQMSGWGMDTHGLQHDHQYPTGTVDISLLAGQPKFDIRAGCAYDFIEPVDLTTLASGEELSLLYHGSLALRSPKSRQTLHQLRTHGQLPAFVDINLRTPWWEKSEITWAVQDARWVKLNDDELSVLHGPHTVTDMRKAAAELQIRHAINTLIVTQGELGAFVLQDRHLHQGLPVPVTTLIDTVGAGDAFSATTIYGLLRGWDIDTILNRAMTFASAICGIRGATLCDRNFYRHFLDHWED